MTFTQNSRGPFSRRVAIAVAAAGLSLGTTLAGAQSTMNKMSAMAASGSSATARGSDAMSQSMMTGMKKMQDMKPSGDTDKDFAMMMKMHHEQALDMAKIEIDQGKSAEMKSMARKIIAAQKKEIAEFEQWMKKHP